MQTEIHHCAASHGATLYYEVTGQGHPLVLLHGNGEDSTYFEHQVPVFSQLYQVIAIDTRAHGRSTHGNAPLDFYLFADDVIAVLDDLASKSAYSGLFRTAVTLRCIPYEIPRAGCSV